MIKTNNDPSIRKNSKLKFITDSESDNSDSRLFFETNAKWLNAEEAAHYLRLPSVGALRNLVADRRVTYHKLGRLLRFRVCDLDDLLEYSRVERRF